MIKARKSLGQNFLVDKTALVRIAMAPDIQKGDRLIEIGPGTGLLTKELLRTDLEQLIAYEVDDRAIDLLNTEIADSRFELRHQDILEANLSSYTDVRIVGNIPYYITSPILFKLIDARKHIRDAHLLMQLEVAERLAASPRSKAYGIPTVLTNFFGEVRFLFKVKASSFRPAPKVDSALVQIDFTKGYFVREKLPPPSGFNEESFRKLIRSAFAMRRKTLRNNLKAFTSEEQLLDPAIAPYLGRRAEELTIAEFLELYNILLR